MVGVTGSQLEMDRREADQFKQSKQDAIMIPKSELVQFANA